MSFYTSLSGLKAAQTDLSVVSNNIANVGSIGFKKSVAVFGDIVAASSTQSNTIGLGTQVKAIDQQFTSGSYNTTDRGLDLAITGQGFFVTRSTEAGGTVGYTRAGAFTTDNENHVIDSNGTFLQVLPVNADGDLTASDLASATNLTLPQMNEAGSKLDNVSVSKKGIVTATFADGSSTKLGRIAIANFAQPEALSQTGNSTWAANGRTGPAIVGGAGDEGFGGIQTNALEQSNVDISEELVKLIQAQRNFQANAKAIDTATQITDIAVNLHN